MKYSGINIFMNYLRYNFKLLPTKEQEEMFFQHAAACKFVWNKILEDNLETHEETGKFPIFENKGIISSKSLRHEHDWIKEVNSQSLQQVENQLKQAFFNRFSKKRKKKAGFPKFKSQKRDKKAFVVPQKDRIKLKDACVKLPKIGWIKMIQHRKFVGKIKQVTIQQDVDEWVASFLIELPNENKSTEPFFEDEILGIDVGIKTFATTSDGEIFDLPASLKKETKKLKKLQRKHSRKTKGSKNRNRARIKVAKQYRRITRIKRDHINCFVKSIAKTYKAVALEDLNIAGMKKNRNLASSIQQLPWDYMKARFKQLMLVHEASRWFPSSKTCSCCGWIKKDLDLGDRVWSCETCNTAHDRDLNAAINLKADARSVFARGGLIRPRSQRIDSLAGSLKQESEIVGSP